MNHDILTELSCGAYCNRFTVVDNRLNSLYGKEYLEDREGNRVWVKIMKAIYLKAPSRLFMLGITTKPRLRGMFKPQAAHPANPVRKPIASISLMSRT
ncbi:MAG: hypothetical protein WAZ30_09335 [Syntrophorhabdus sp.]